VILESGFTPISITLGHPRFKLRYELGGRAKLLAPTRELFAVTDETEYFRGYDRQLADTGFQAIARELDELWENSGRPTGLVLCCFEDVWAGENCHRRSAARFWLDHTGQQVPELAPLQPPLWKDRYTP